mmetsp:Transcript_41824/g.94073  ORF Transcript_41824/g.94073 Transcript_41824/m.94073 type:complete len:233 (-) Transcript_41824:15-713(-)
MPLRGFRISLPPMKARGRVLRGCALAIAVAATVADGLGFSFAPSSARVANSRSSAVAMQARAGNTARERRARVIANLQMQPRKFSNERMDKHMKRIEKQAEKDAEINEFMSFARPMASAGEYAMPVAKVRDFLTNIYGEDDTLDSLQAELEVDGVEEFRDLQDLRRGASATNARKPQTYRERIKVGGTAGLAKIVGRGREVVIDNRQGGLGVRGGSKTDDYQRVWVSGASTG